MGMSRESVVRAVEWLNDTDPIISPKRFTWNFRRKNLRERMLLAGGNLDELYTWPVAREFLVTGATTHTRRIERGLPQDYGELITRVKGSPVAGTYIRQAYAHHVMANKLYKDTRVYEFGGGLGVLPIVMAEMGHRGLYTIYDFPEMSIIQEWAHTVAKLDNVSYANRLHKTECDIFVSVCALDEASLQARIEALAKVHAPIHMVWITKSYLGADDQGPDDNLVWFDKYYADNGFSTKRIDALDNSQIILLSERV